MLLLQFSKRQHKNSHFARAVQPERAISQNKFYTLPHLVKLRLALTDIELGLYLERRIKVYL